MQNVEFVFCINRLCENRNGEWNKGEGNIELAGGFVSG